MIQATRTVTIQNIQGLHARPVMRFVDLASRFECQVHIKKDDLLVDAKNPMEMMLLEATKGTVLELVAEGPDAEPALDALVELVNSRFGED